MNHQAPAGYVGFVTRAVALVIDAVIIDVVAIVTAAAASLIANLFGGDSTLTAVQAAIGGVVWFLWSAVYFVTFWTLTGQTPGQRILGFRVLPVAGGSIRPVRAIRRFIGMIISIIPLGAGFLPVLVDDRRRGLHDRIGGTVVKWEAEPVVEIVPAPPVHVRPLTPMLEPGPEAVVPPAAPADGPEVPLA
jgi:uncharacterized RDD family membrane protein YckC